VSRVSTYDFLVSLSFCVALMTSACSRSNNLLLGRVEARVGEHVVIVTDCYRTSVPPPQLLKDAEAKPFYRFAPCLDADVVFNGNQLLVNGKSYGSIEQADTVIVDHGVVLVNGMKRQATSGKNVEPNGPPIRRNL